MPNEGIPPLPQAPPYEHPCAMAWEAAYQANVALYSAAAAELVLVTQLAALTEQANQARFATQQARTNYDYALTAFDTCMSGHTVDPGDTE